MEITEVDGVTVLTEPATGPLSATLTFGCGVRDETFRTIGVTNLLQQLALDQLETGEADGVDLDACYFSMEGDPAEVADWLADLCRLLGRLPLERIPEITPHLDPQDRNSELDTAAVLYDRRFGRRGQGLARWSGYGYQSLTAEDVHAHAERFFVSGNAVLELVGSVPAGLRLPLPPGPRAVHEPVPEQRPTGPRWSAEWGATVGLSLRGDHHMAWPVAQDLLHARLHGSVAREIANIDETRREVLLTHIVAPGRRGVAFAEEMWQALRSLAGEGPSEAELDAARAAYDGIDPESSPDKVVDRILFGVRYPTAAEAREQLDGLTPQSIAATLSEGIGSLLMVVPYGVRPDLPGVTEDLCPRGSVAPDGKVFGRARTGRLFGREAESERLVLTDDGVSRVDGDGSVHTVLFSDVVQVRIDDEARVMFGGNGCVVPVDPKLYPGSGVAVDIIDAIPGLPVQTD
jgi:hypothetical protein